MIYIYIVRNTVNAKCYVGQSKEINRRWKTHKSGNGSKLLASAIKKYGLESFEFEVIDQRDTQEQADSLETYYIKHYNTLYPTGYNLAPSATQARISKIPTDVQQYIVDQYALDVPVKEISAATGYSIGAIVKTLARCNIPKRAPIQKRRHSKINKSTLIAMLADGKTKTEIARYFNTNYKYIWKYCKEHGIEE